jgi:transforming growth factor-beta-induced protein
LTQYPDVLLQVLKYHVLSGPVLSGAIAISSSLPTLEGESIVVTSPAGNPLVDGNQILRKDLSGSNGVLHVIPSVLYPPSLRSKWIIPTLNDDGYKTFVSAVFLAAVNASFIPPNIVTVFVPSEAAWLKLGSTQLNQIFSSPSTLAQYALHHVVSGFQLSNTFANGKSYVTLAGTSLILNIRNLQWRVNDVLINKFDTLAFNGAYHVIDTVLNPFPVRTVVDVLPTLGLTTFYNLLNLTGDNVLLNSTGPWTLFAPTNEALAKVNLTSDLAILKGQLLYHVVGGVLTFNTSFPVSFPSQLNNRNLAEPLNFTLSSNGTVTINGYVAVLSPAVNATNGVVYIISDFIKTTVLDPKPIPQTLLRNDLSITWAAWNATGLLDVLLSQDITVFAPTNIAWQTALPPGYTLDILFANPNVLSSILFYQVSNSRLTTSFLQTGVLRQIPTLLQGESLTLDLQINKYTINGATIVQSDIQATNGVVQAINQVVFPSEILPQTVWQTITRNPDYSSFANLVQRAGYADYLQNGANLTVFVPNNAVFAATNIDPTQVVPIIQYHIVNGVFFLSALRTVGTLLTIQGSALTFTSALGGQLLINTAQVIRSDITATNGVIFTIDSVLLPTTIFPNSVADAARLAGLTTLSDLITISGLTTTLLGAGPFTLLAPTNEAFAALSPAFLAQLRSEPATIRSILLNHVITQYYPTTKLQSGISLNSVYGEAINVTRSSSVSITFTSVAGVVADLVVQNLFAQNGVVQVIDEVLIPLPLIPRTLQSLILANPNLSMFYNILIQTGLNSTFFSPLPRSLTVFAPTNQAIQAALTAYPLQLTDPNVVSLVVQYHFVVNSFPTSLLPNGLVLSTSSRGQPLTVSNTNGVLKLVTNRNPAITAAFVSVNATATAPLNSGILHTIDTVLIPAGVGI